MHNLFRKRANMAFDCLDISRSVLKWHLTSRSALYVALAFTEHTDVALAFVESADVASIVTVGILS